MVTYSKRIISILTCICLLFCYFSSAVLADYSSGDYAVTYWEQLLATVASGASQSWFANVPIAGILPKAVAKTAATLDSDVCASSSDGFHHTSSLSGSTVKKGADGKLYAVCSCSDCGDTFRLFGDDVSQGYTSYVSSIDKSGVTDNTDGSFIWQPTLDNCSSFDLGTTSASERRSTNYYSLGSHSFLGLQCIL